MRPSTESRSATLRFTLTALALTGAFASGYLARSPQKTAPADATTAARSSNTRASSVAGSSDDTEPRAANPTLAARDDKATALIRKNHQKFAEFNFGSTLSPSSGMISYFDLSMSERAELDRIVAEAKAAMEQREVELATASQPSDHQHVRDLPADAEFAAATKKRFMDQLHLLLGDDSLELLRYASDEYFDPFKGPRRITCTVSTGSDQQPNYGIEITKLNVSGNEIGRISIIGCPTIAGTRGPSTYTHLFSDL
jgi:hypothetical protein